MHRVILGFLLTFVVCAQNVPRAEYPQPQFQREQWQTLNGNWEFEFDDADVGIDQAWFSGTKALSKSIIVPYAFETKLSGIGDTSFHPQIWYRRSFSVPPGWKGKRVLLHFGAVDYQARIWLNGKAIGEHEGGHTPFRFDVTPYLQAGANTLVVRSWDPPSDRSIPRGKQYWEPKSRGIFYTRTSGIWQPVWLEAAGETYLERVKIDATQDGLVKLEARIARPQPGTEFRAIISQANHVVATAIVKAAGRWAVAAAQVKDPKLWSVGTPNLYDVTFELHRSGVVDRVQSYLGFRTIGFADGRITINNRATYLKMLLDQGYWPESTLTPPSDEAIQYDIRMSKEMGFNGCSQAPEIGRSTLSVLGRQNGLSCLERDGQLLLVRRYLRCTVHQGVDSGCRARLQSPVDHYVDSDQRELGRAQPA